MTTCGTALLVSVLIFCFTAGSANGEIKERQLGADLLLISSSPTIQINAGGESADRSPMTMTMCDGDWMGIPRYALNSWFTGQEYYATYQDPIETGCPLSVTYPFQVDSVIWHVYNPNPSPLVIPVQPLIFGADLTDPLCPKPAEVICYGQVFNLAIPTGSILISMPMECCVSGPYFAGVWAPDLIGPGFLGLVTDSAGTGGSFGASRTCANYNNYQGFHEDLIVGYSFPGNIRLWSVGTASDMNNCDNCAYLIEPGVDLWETPPGNSFGHQFVADPIPADFFNPGSEPFLGSICLSGDPLTTNPGGALGRTDVIVERQAPASLPAVGANDQVPIEIVALNLVSCQPITVTYPSAPPELWDVRVTLSTNQPQSQGLMDIRKDCCNGGTFTTDLPVLPKFIFTRQSDLTQRVLDLGGLRPPLVFQTINGHWSYEISLPFDLVICPGLVALDHDLLPSTPDILILPSSKFTTGFRTLPCDPDSPNEPFCGGLVLTGLNDDQAELYCKPVLESPLTNIGSCCPDGIDNESCIETTEDCCENIASGAYAGDGTVCTPTECAPPKVVDTVCSDFVDNECDGTVDDADPSCSSSGLGVTCALPYDNKTIISRSADTPYVAGQIIDIEIVQLSLAGSTPAVGAIYIQESPTQASNGSISVNTVDGSGNITGAFVSVDVFFDFVLLDSAKTLKSVTPLKLEANITSWPPPPGTIFSTPLSAPPAELQYFGTTRGYFCYLKHVISDCNPPSCCIGLRGDPNGDGAEANVLDLTFAVDRIFRGGPPAACPEEGDPNGDSASLNVLDLTFFVDRIFRGGPPPVSCI